MSKQPQRRRANSPRPPFRLDTLPPPVPSLPFDSEPCNKRPDPSSYTNNPWADALRRRAQEQRQAPNNGIRKTSTANSLRPPVENSPDGVDVVKAQEANLRQHDADFRSGPSTFGGFFKPKPRRAPVNFSADTSYRGGYGFNDNGPAARAKRSHQPVWKRFFG